MKKNKITDEDIKNIVEELAKQTVELYDLYNKYCNLEKQTKKDTEIINHIKNIIDNNFENIKTIRIKYIKKTKI